MKISELDHMEAIQCQPSKSSRVPAKGSGRVAGAEAAGVRAPVPSERAGERENAAFSKALISQVEKLE